MNEKYQIAKITDYQYRVRQRCLNTELGFVVLADFYGPPSENNAKIFLATLKEQAEKGV